MAKKKKTTKHKQLYPIIVIKARDWSIYSDTYRINKGEDWDVTNGWMVGWLIREQGDSFVIAFEIFEESLYNKMRHIQVVPKETILFKKIIKDI